MFTQRDPRWVALLLPLFTLACGERPPVGNASENQQGPSFGATDSPTGSVGQPTVERTLASWLLVENEGRMALAQLASERAERDEVKQLAAQIAEDGQRLLGGLQPLAGSGAAPAKTGLPDARSTQGSRSEGGGGNRGNTSPTGQGEADPSGATRGGVDIIALKEELGRECLASARRYLEGKSGSEFDRAWIGLVSVKLMEALDTIRVFQRHTEARLGQALLDVSSGLRAQLDRAESLRAELMAEDQPAGVSSPGK